MLKVFRKIIKWGFRLLILILVVILVVFVYNFLINGVTGQAGNKCQEITKQNGGGKEVVYPALADWLKTQSTSLVIVNDAYYQNDSKNGDEIIVKYSLYGKIYSGKRIINSKTLQRFCGL